MQREIKFRAWDTKTAQMKAWEFLQDGGDDYWPPISSVLEGSDGWVPMQFTGLRDKNGTEIYEGDIIRFVEDDEPTHIATVSWIDDGFKLVGEYFNGDDLFPQIRSTQGYNDGKAIWGEVIGNIYENPELLK